MQLEISFMLIFNPNSPTAALFRGGCLGCFEEIDALLVTNVANNSSGTLFAVLDPTAPAPDSSDFLR